MSTEAALHIVIIWEKSRNKQGEILADIDKSFRFRRVFEIQWSDKCFTSSLSRFYGTKLPKRSSKEKECGRGPFILAVFEDENPLYDDMDVNPDKKATVNKNVFNKKQYYRSQTRGSYNIHSSNDLPETRHDLMLLLGLTIDEFNSNYPGDWDGNIEYLQQDLIGSHGWSNIAQLFHVLNETIAYVVLRNFECLPDQYTLEEHGDIDLLVADLEEMVHITNATSVFEKPYRVHYRVSINSEDIPFDFRHVGDRYYDESFELDILNSRIHTQQGFYTPDPHLHFYSLLYHALVHKEKIANDYFTRLEELAVIIQIDDFKERLNQSWTRYLIELLDNFMKSRNYKYTSPFDKSVFFNTGNIADASMITNLPRWYERLQRRDFIKIRLRPNRILVHILSGVLPINIIRLKFALGGLVKIDLCLGKIKDI